MKEIIVISSYPQKDLTHGISTVGVASYAKNTLTALHKAAKNTLAIKVLAEVMPKSRNYTHDNIHVKRVWKRNSLQIFPKLLKEILKDKKNDTVVIEFELAMFGGIIALLPFPLFLLFLRLFQKKTILVLHQVVTDIESVGPHVALSGTSRLPLILNLGLSFFYRMALLLANKVIVFEPGMKETLSNYGNIKKVSVIAHGVEKFSHIPTNLSARKKLSIASDEYVIMTFGYLAWYKGTDWIINAVSEIKKKKKHLKIKLILAGGKNPNHNNKEFYLRYISNLTREAESIGVTVTGFVPEDKISTYYQAADIVVLPYRTHMSSSGPLSMAFAFSKPFLLSYSLKEVLQQSDMTEILKKLKIVPEKIIFKTSDDLLKKITDIKSNNRLSQKLSTLSHEVALKRNWDNIGEQYYEQISF